MKLPPMGVTALAPATVITAAAECSSDDGGSGSAGPNAAPCPTTAGRDGTHSLAARAVKPVPLWDRHSGPAAGGLK